MFEPDDGLYARWMALDEGWQATLLGLLVTLAAGVGLRIPW